MGVMRVLGISGDIETHWEKNTEAERIAREEFELHLEEGMIAFLVDPETGQGSELIRKFDPNAQEIILSRRLVGG